jgi:hypothetical protein
MRTIWRAKLEAANCAGRRGPVCGKRRSRTVGIRKPRKYCSVIRSWAAFEAA